MKTAMCHWKKAKAHGRFVDSDRKVPSHDADGEIVSNGQTSLTAQHQNSDSQNLSLNLVVGILG
jgi:hypothetical protein